MAYARPRDDSERGNVSASSTRSSILVLLNSAPSLLVRPRTVSVAFILSPPVSVPRIAAPEFVHQRKNKNASPGGKNPRSQNTPPHNSGASRWGFLGGFFILSTVEISTDIFQYKVGTVLLPYRSTVVGIRRDLDRRYIQKSVFGFLVIRNPPFCPIYAD